MKNKTGKILIIVFSCVLGMQFAGQVFAANGLTVSFEPNPLFGNTNFLPGDKVTGVVRATNDTGETKSIAAEAINWRGFPNDKDIPSDDLSRVLNIVIRENGGGNLYGPATLFDFYENGETHLSDILSGSSAEYDFEITFPDDAGDKWQGKTTGFDILIGSQNAENGGGVEVFTSASVGGGGGLPRGLTIYEPVSVVPETASATIIWDTSYESTSRVVWSETPGQFNLSAGEPSYGYDNWTAEDANKVIHHTVVLTGLTPGTTYYYRCISHGSFALSLEHSFTTLTEGEEYVPEKQDENGQVFQNNIVAGNPLVNNGVQEETDSSNGAFNNTLNDSSDNILNRLFAAVGWENYWWLLLILIFVLAILLFLRVRNDRIKRKKES
jgi:Purple acid Phosphatase, N-terminal domain